MPDLDGMKSAEQWLADRGVERQPLVVRLDDPPPAADPAAAAPATTPEAAPQPAADPIPATAVTEPRAVESARVALAAADERALAADIAAAQPRQHDNLADDVAVAMGYIRSATATTPMSEGRLRSKLADRGHPDAVVRAALDQARAERLVDDAAFAGALVQEWLDKGHAGVRIRNDLRKRGFDEALVTEVLARIESPDPEAAAFAVARERADQLSGLSPETAYRRLVAYLARRGHSEGLARKVARQVLWVEREAQQTAGH